MTFSYTLNPYIYICYVLMLIKATNSNLDFICVTNHGRFKHMYTHPLRAMKNQIQIPCACTHVLPMRTILVSGFAYFFYPQKAIYFCTDVEEIQSCISIKFALNFISVLTVFTTSYCLLLKLSKSAKTPQHNTPLACYCSMLVLCCAGGFRGHDP